MGRLGGVVKFDDAIMRQDAEELHHPDLGGEPSEIVSSDPVVQGTVKWFDVVKGFGFVVAEDGGPDILLHANVLRNFGQGSVADGSSVELRIQRTERGLQATEVLTIIPPEGSETDFNFEGLSADHSDAELIPARVKWFDKAKGFGFANAYGDLDDIFLHIEVLRRCGLADLQAGEAVCIRSVDGERGQMAIEVHPWDFASTNT